MLESVKPQQNLTYMEMMQIAISKGLKSLDVAIVGRTYKSIMVKATLIMKSRVFTSLAEGSWNEGLESISHRAKQLVLAEAIGISYEVNKPENIEDDSITSPQLQLLNQLYDRLGKTDEEKNALPKLSKAAASALITMLKYEVRRQA